MYYICDMIIKEKFNRTTDKPYNMVHSSVQKDLRISANAMRLWMTLYYSAKDYDPTQASLAKQFGVSLRTIKNWIKELKTYGYINIKGSQETGYTWIINKYSKVQKTAPTNRQKIALLIKDNGGCEADPPIANNEEIKIVEEVDYNLGINND